jgi:hypothetical protein
MDKSTINSVDVYCEKCGHLLKLDADITKKSIVKVPPCPGCLLDKENDAIRLATKLIYEATK